MYKVFGSWSVVRFYLIFLIVIVQSIKKKTQNLVNVLQYVYQWKQTDSKL